MTKKKETIKEINLNKDNDIKETLTINNQILNNENFKNLIKEKDKLKNIDIKSVYFPHSEIRNIQDEFIDAVIEAVNNKKHLIAHAPTGLGKTAAALSPALTYTLKNKKTIFFLTSRHTQHNIVNETLKLIKKKHEQDFITTDVIGKKHMCLQNGIERLYNSEFIEFCKNLREDGTCEFYNNTYEDKKSKLSFRADEAINSLKIKGINTSNDIIRFCELEKDKLCPYEISYKLAKDAKVIIADYYHIFNSHIQNTLFKKINKELKDCIIIIDEAHNLPDRIRELMSEQLSLTRLDRAINEAKKYKYDETRYILYKIKEKVIELGDTVPEKETEKLITHKEFVEKISEIDEYRKILDDLIFVGDEIRKEHKRSYIAGIAEMMYHWYKDKNNIEYDDPDREEKWEKAFICYIRIDPKNNDVIIRSKCLDPGIITGEIINETHTTILMSGTLLPIEMYRDILDLKKEKTIVKELPCPFPPANKLSLIVPETSTKYTERSDDQFKKIATITVNIANSIDGNVAIFFPSYYIKNQIEKYFFKMYKNKIFSETQFMESEERHELIEDFKKNNEDGSILMAVASGSYGEGIDLPGNLLKGVIVVGLPLGKPDLETKELINYYDKKFRKGWDYGYLFPAFNKTLQNAGRCIRTHDDKGIIVYLDERYEWRNYYRCFPKDLKIKITKNFRKEIKEFFDNHEKDKK